jgi:hypothetical protein
MFTMKNKVVGQTSIVSDNLVQSVAQNICERLWFTISKLSCEFSQITCAVLYGIIAVRLGYNRLCTKGVLKILIGVHKMQRIAFALIFLRNSTKFVIHVLITL